MAQKRRTVGVDLCADCLERDKRMSMFATKGCLPSWSKSNYWRWRRCDHWLLWTVPDFHGGRYSFPTTHVQNGRGWFSCSSRDRGDWHPYGVRIEPSFIVIEYCSLYYPRVNQYKFLCYVHNYIIVVAYWKLYLTKVYSNPSLNINIDSNNERPGACRGFVQHYALVALEWTLNFTSVFTCRINYMFMYVVNYELCENQLKTNHCNI